MPFRTFWLHVSISPSVVCRLNHHCTVFIHAQRCGVGRRGKEENIDSVQTLLLRHKKDYDSIRVRPMPVHKHHL